jgi:hypothetical protein
MRPKKPAVLLSLLISLTLAVPAKADFCIQIAPSASNPACPLSGALGFFRFKGALPKAANRVKPLLGRVAGLSPAFGTVTVYPDASGIELGATFFADAVQGQFDVTLFAPGFNSGEGYADYGAYGANFGCDVELVSCALEP